MSGHFDESLADVGEGRVGVRVPYEIDGQVVPSVTEILKYAGFGTEQLIGWANSLGKKGKDYKTELDRTAAIGVAVHACIEMELTGEKYDIPVDLISDVFPILELYRSWSADKEIEVVRHEFRMTSRTFMCGEPGTCWHM